MKMAKNPDLETSNWAHSSNLMSYRDVRPLIRFLDHENPPVPVGKIDFKVNPGSDFSKYWFFGHF